MPAVQVFSDFDGTICLKDTGCILIDSGMGYANRKALDAKVLSHEMTFLEAMHLFWDSVSLTWEEGLDLVRDAELDPGFVKFHNYVCQQKIPFAVVSCGLDILIKEYMKLHLGPEQASQLNILANYGSVDNRKWNVTFRDDSPHTHDKSRCIKEARKAFEEAKALQKKALTEMAQEQFDQQQHHHHHHHHDHQVIVFCGDGISDLSAAREADVLFARRGRDLETYCRTHRLPFLPFDTFEEVHDVVQGLYEGVISIEDIQKRQQAECQKPFPN
ncbi:hypothetical protein BGW41_007267 [Actinomortierella wolfii]|nr:hypothetical protein BGW41_007267 [Actinomortierella wolfii]